jgi:hypothetical protein
MSSQGKPSTFFNQIPPEKEILYHYTTKETALEKILDSGKLRFNKFGMTNDPKETNYWLFNYRYSYNDMGKAYPDCNDYLNNLLKKHSNILCFTIDNLNLEVDQNNRNGYMHSRSWAQYAGSHSGICLLFDKQKLINAITDKFSDSYSIWYGNVEYKNRLNKGNGNCSTVTSKVINEQSLVEHIFNYKKELFFEKRTDWSDENEYRIIVYTPELVEDYLLIDIANSITGIIVGVDFHDVYVPSIKEFCKKYNISADRIQWFNGCPVLCCPIFDQHIN